MKQIEFERWEPDAENPRRLTYAGRRTAEDVFHELEAQLDSVGYLPDEYRYTKPENLSPKMKIFSKIPQRCLKTTSASAHRNRLSSRSAALLTQKHSHRLCCPLTGVTTLAGVTRLVFQAPVGFSIGV